MWDNIAGEATGAVSDSEICAVMDIIIIIIFDANIMTDVHEVNH